MNKRKRFSYRDETITILLKLILNKKQPNSNDAMYWKSISNELHTTIQDKDENFDWKILKKFFHNVLLIRLRNQKFGLKKAEARKIMYPYLPEIFNIYLFFIKNNDKKLFNLESALNDIIMKHHRLFIKYILNRSIFDMEIWDLFNRINPNGNVKDIIINVDLFFLDTTSKLKLISSNGKRIPLINQKSNLFNNVGDEIQKIQDTSNEKPGTNSNIPLINQIPNLINEVRAENIKENQNTSEIILSKYDINSVENSSNIKNIVNGTISTSDMKFPATVHTEYSSSSNEIGGKEIQEIHNYFKVPTTLPNSNIPCINQNSNLINEVGEENKEIHNTYENSLSKNDTNSVENSSIIKNIENETISKNDIKFPVTVFIEYFSSCDEVNEKGTPDFQNNSEFPTTPINSNIPCINQNSNLINIVGEENKEIHNTYENSLSTNDTNSVENSSIIKNIENETISKNDIKFPVTIFNEFFSSCDEVDEEGIPEFQNNSEFPTTPPNSNIPCINQNCNIINEVCGGNMKEIQNTSENIVSKSDINNVPNLSIIKSIEKHGRIPLELFITVNSSSSDDDIINNSNKRRKRKGKLNSKKKKAKSENNNCKDSDVEIISEKDDTPIEISSDEVKISSFSDSDENLNAIVPIRKLRKKNERVITRLEQIKYLNIKSDFVRSPE